MTVFMYLLHTFSIFVFFFLNDTAPTDISPLSLHDALPISFAAPFFLRNNGADRTNLARRCFLAQVFSLTFPGLASQAERPRTNPLKIMISSPPAEARIGRAHV